MKALERHPEIMEPSRLAPIVRRLLGRDSVVTTCMTEPLEASTAADQMHPPAVVRVKGTAEREGAVTPWSLMLKSVPAADAGEEPSAPDFRAREPLVYESGMLERIQGVAVPRCYGVETRPDGGWWLWIEDLVDCIGLAWPASRYVSVARDVGRFGGIPRAGDLAACPWLSRSPLRETVRQFSPTVAAIRDARQEPQVANAISEVSANELLDLLEHVPSWLAALDRLPQVLCHWDVQRVNLFSRTVASGAMETVAIDWGGVGWGPRGVDLSHLFSQAVLFFNLDPKVLPDLDRDVFADYLTGLRESGWAGKPEVVRFAYTAASSMRLIILVATAIRVVGDVRARVVFERASSLSLPALIEKFRLELEYYLSHVQEAKRLARFVGESVVSPQVSR